ncbi:hypothetical protein AVEN_170530-1, partial [Araneus ventricosus]
IDLHVTPKLPVFHICGRFCKEQSDFRGVECLRMTDLICTRPAYTPNLKWNRVENPRSSCPESKTATKKKSRLQLLYIH